MPLFEIGSHPPTSVPDSLLYWLHSTHSFPRATYCLVAVEGLVSTPPGEGYILCQSHCAYSLAWVLTALVPNGIKKLFLHLFIFCLYLDISSGHPGEGNDSAPQQTVFNAILKSIN